MPIRLGEHPQPGFDQPLDLLGDCHRRIEQFLGILVRVAGERLGRELNADQQRGVETALRYFREALPRHAADEDQSLFPRLLASPDGRVRDLLPRLAQLERDHKRAADAHAEVERLGQRWLQHGTLGLEEANQLVATLQQLEALYIEHIRTEDREVFPLARQVLSDKDQAAIGVEMLARRDARG